MLRHEDINYFSMKTYDNAEIKHNILSTSKLDGSEWSPSGSSGLYQEMDIVLVGG